MDPTSNSQAIRNPSPDMSSADPFHKRRLLLSSNYPLGMPEATSSPLNGDLEAPIAKRLRQDKPQITSSIQALSQVHALSKPILTRFPGSPQSTMNPIPRINRGLLDYQTAIACQSGGSVTEKLSIPIESEEEAIELAQLLYKNLLTFKGVGDKFLSIQQIDYKRLNITLKTYISVLYNYYSSQGNCDWINKHYNFLINDYLPGLIEHYQRSFISLPEPLITTFVLQYLTLKYYSAELQQNEDLELLAGDHDAEELYSAIVQLSDLDKITLATSGLNRITPRIRNEIETNSAITDLRNLAKLRLILLGHRYKSFTAHPDAPEIAVLNKLSGSLIISDTIAECLLSSNRLVRNRATLLSMLTKEKIDEKDSRILSILVSGTQDDSETWIMANHMLAEYFINQPEGVSNAQPEGVSNAFKLYDNITYNHQISHVRMCLAMLDKAILIHQNPKIFGSDDIVAFKLLSTLIDDQRLKQRLNHRAKYRMALMIIQERFENQPNVNKELAIEYLQFLATNLEVEESIKTKAKNLLTEIGIEPENEE